MSGNAHQRRLRMREEERKLPPMPRAVSRWLRQNFEVMLRLPDRTYSLLVTSPGTPGSVRVALGSTSATVTPLTYSPYTKLLCLYSDPDFYTKLTEQIRLTCKLVAEARELQERQAIRRQCCC